MLSEESCASGQAQGKGSGEAPRERLFHLHIAIAHFPIALVGISLVFYLLDLAGIGEELGSCSRICLVSALASIPLAALAGILSWRRSRRDAQPGIFHAKLFLSGLLFVAGIATAGPELAREANRPSYGFGLLLCSWLAVLLSQLGGIIVFRGLGLRKAVEDRDRAS